MKDNNITELTTDKTSKPKRKRKFLRRFLISMPLALFGWVLFLYGTGTPHQACGCGPSEEYFAHLNNNQALTIIRTRLEDAGLNFDSQVPKYTIERFGGHRWGRNIGIDFFDAERNVAITFVNYFTNGISSSGLSNRPFNTNRIIDEFSENFAGIHFGVFYNPAIWRPWHQQTRWGRSRPHTTNETERLIEQLENQIQAFIDQLRAEGIID